MQQRIHRSVWLLQISYMKDFKRKERPERVDRVPRTEGWLP